MDTQLSPLWTHLSSENRITGTWRTALPAYEDQPSTCLGACPVNGQIATWIRQVKKGDTYGAFVTLAKNNPFPAIAGRICHHPCETACNRVLLDGTVGICSLERFVGDTALAQNWSFPASPIEHDERVAIIGGGPAGLSAAYQLRRLGIQVTLFEKADELGGLMRFGIPSYRLARSVLDGEVNRITDMDIDVRLNAKVSDAAALERLREDFDAVYLAVGASLPKQLPGVDYSLAFVVDSAAFLAAPKEKQSTLAGDHVLVIGGGSAAMDVARSARRLGRRVTVMTLEPDGQLPAQQVELDEGTEEGIEFISSVMLQKAVKAKNAVSVSCIKVDFESGENAGQFHLTPLPGTEFSLSVNTIIPAIGQDVDLSPWHEILDDNTGPVIATNSIWQTNVPGIFAGGDVASMERFVTKAVGMGKEAANAIATTLVDDISSPVPAMTTLVDYDRINTAYQEEFARTAQPILDVSTRLANFDEVQQGLSGDQASTEAARCFSCGTCIFCDNCYFYCPDMAITKLDKGYEVNSDYCKGCGLCVMECPTGSIHMREDQTT